MPRRTTADDNRAEHEDTRTELGTAITTATSQVRDHATDLHRDLLEVVNRGFDDLRADNRELRSRLDQTTTDLADTRRQIETIRSEAAEARNPAQPAPGIEATDTGGHYDLLQAAAGTAYAELVCHRDTWDWLVAQAAPGEHFRLPGDVTEEDDGRIDVDLSGRTLIAVLDALWHTQRHAPGVGTQALAQRIYERAADALQTVQPASVESAETEDGQRPKPKDVVRIVIDDRP